MLAEARRRIRWYTPEEARVDDEVLLVDTLVELGVEGGDLIGAYEALA